MNPFAAGLAGYAGGALYDSYKNAYAAPQQLPYGYGLDSPEEVAIAEAHPGLYQTYLYKEAQRIAADRTAQIQADHRANIRAGWLTVFLVVLTDVVIFMVGVL